MKNAIQKRVIAKLMFFRPKEILTSKIDYMFCGQGYGVLQDAEGKTYLLEGQEIGGGKYNESADKKFMKSINYLITSVIKNDGSENHKFYGCDYKVMKIETMEGVKPSTEESDKTNLEIRRIVEYSSLTDHCFSLHTP